MKKAGSVDAYLKMHPPAVRKRLAAVRALIRKAAPGAEEKISYGIPAYALEGRLLYFATHAGHIGVYPVTAALRKELGDALKPYVSKTAKSTIRLPHDEPLPLALLTKVVKVRVKENVEGRARPSAKARARS
jgi:uncharacterized protein YdhG (YjbR/CyaY superfamily)